jgi:hypothetical protein
VPGSELGDPRADDPAADDEQIEPTSSQTLESGRARVFRRCAHGRIQPDEDEAQEP